ncbi:MFS transporter [Streptomyces sp. NPDC002588]|uniref:MFS transporter n=1 Tax=Streptomyces sp. NPDC002588 TaxID=3154419 RepID=UPI00332A2381
MRLSSPYQRLFTLPGFGGSLIAATSGKLQPGIFPLSLLLAVAHYRSMHTAAIVVALYSLGGATSPLRGRLLDRYGYARVMWPTLFLHLAVLSALVVNERAGGPLAVTGVCAVVATVTLPPVAIVTRLMWRSLATGDLRTTALSLDAVLTDVGFIAGPSLAVFLVQWVAPWAGLAASALLMTIATILLLFSGRLPEQQLAPAVRDWLGPLRLRQLRKVLASALLFFLALQTIDLAFPAWAEEHDMPLMSGVLLSTMAIGSVTGGLVLGALPPKWSKRCGLSVTLTALAVGTGSAAAASETHLGVLVAAAAMLGLALGPTFVALYGTVGDLAPADRAAEAQAWIISFMSIGGAAGSAISGIVSQKFGAGMALFVASVCFAAAAVLAHTPQEGREPILGDAL